MKYEKPIIIFSDLDGTLLGNNHYFSSKTRELVQKVYDKGYLFIPITARPTGDIFTQAKRLKIDQNLGIIAGNNGSQIYDFRTKTWILNEYLPRNVVEQIFKNNFNTYKAKVHFFGDYETYVFNEGKNSLYWAQILGIDYIVAHSFEEIQKDISHLTIILKKETTIKESNEFLNELKSKFGDIVQIIAYTSRVIEVTPKFINKGYAVKIISKYLEIDSSKTKSYAFGDEYNDLTLLDSVDIGIAMENANLQLKDVADEITEFSNNDDGVACYIEKKILNF